MLRAAARAARARALCSLIGGRARLLAVPKRGPRLSNPPKLSFRPSARIARFACPICRDCRRRRRSAACACRACADSSKVGAGCVGRGGAGREGVNGGAQYLKRQAVRQWQRLPERQRATQTGRLAVDRIDGAELTRLLAAIRRRPPVAVRLGAVFDGNKVLL